MKHTSETLHSQGQSNDHGVQQEALEFKHLMDACIGRSGLQHKAIASDLGVSDSTLSHWISPSCKFTMPAHLVPTFCQLVGDDSLIWHLMGRVQP